MVSDDLMNTSDRKKLIETTRKSRGDLKIAFIKLDLFSLKNMKPGLSLKKSIINIAGGLSATRLGLAHSTSIYIRPVLIIAFIGKAIKN